ncbi:MAG TPA: hypothetical protein VLB81_06150 [Gaiellales bacterium]|nr:hypothetical protein [Gaiellales bacterium]
MTPAAQEILDLFGLPGSVVSMTAVGGAWSNRVYRLETTRSAFAVKELCNPWADERWQEWLDETWRFERRAIAAGVPAPEPIPSAGGGCVADWAGRVLATLHGFAFEPGNRAVFPVSNTETADRWPELCDAAHRADASWADRLDDAAAAVATAAGLAREAGRSADTAIEPPDLGQSLMTGLDWIAFNVECAIGQRSAPPARAALAESLVPGLLAAFPRRMAAALRVGATLRP